MQTISSHLRSSLYFFGLLLLFSFLLHQLMLACADVHVPNVHISLLQCSKYFVLEPNKLTEYTVERLNVSGLKMTHNCSNASCTDVFKRFFRTCETHFRTCIEFQDNFQNFTNFRTMAMSEHTSQKHCRALTTRCQL